MPRARRADVELRTEIRKNRRDLKRAEKDFKRFAKNAKGSLVGGFKGAFGQIAAFGTVGGLAVIGADVMDFERSFTRLGIQFELAGEAFDKGKFRGAITKLSKDTGIARTDVLKLADEITNLEGKTGLTTAKLETLTLAAQGTGTEMRDLAGLTLGVRDAFKIKEADDLNKVLSRFITIGGKGSVPLKDLARGLRSSAGSFARLQGAGEDSAATLAAVFQVAAAGGITTVDETSTAVQRLVSNLEILDKKKAQKLGIRGAAGELRPLSEILSKIGNSDIISDPKKFKKAFPSEPARRLLRILVGNKTAMDNFVESSRGSNALNESAEKYAQSTSGRMEKALNRAKLAVIEAFTPERIEALIRAAEAFTVALGFVIDHWKLFAGAFVAVKALQVGETLLKWASAANKLAGATSVVAKGKRAFTGLALAAQVGTTNIDGTRTSLGKAGVAAGRFASSVAKISAGLGALAVGFEIGQFLENQFGVGTKITNALGFQTAEQERVENLRRRKESARNLGVAGEASQGLIEAGLVSETGEIDPELVKSLLRSRQSGRELTSAEQAAQTVLQGDQRSAAGEKLFKSELLQPETFTSALFENLSRESREEFRRKGFDVGEPADVLGAAPAVAPLGATENLEEQRRRQALDERLVKALEALENLSVEVKVDADVVARANEKAADNRRRTAS